jgi:ADP-ribose pyrophosphatase
MAHKRSRSKPVVLGAGHWLRLVHVDGWEFVERVKATGVVAIVAVTPDGELILTEQFRRSVNGRVIDLPAGLAGDGPESEELVTAARRELIEETGYDARRFTLLAHAPTSDVDLVWHAR